MNTGELEDVVVAVVAMAGNTPGLVVDVTCPSAQNPALRAFSALRAIGIQIAHARIRLERGAMVQVLQLRETDDRIPASDRVPQVLAALREACRLPIGEPDRAESASLMA